MVILEGDGVVSSSARGSTEGGHHKRRESGWALCIAALRSNRRLFSEAVIALVLVNLFGFVSPLVFSIIIDKVLPSQAMSTLGLIAIGLVAIAAFEFAFGTIRQRLLADIRRRMDHELGGVLFRRLLMLPADTFTRRGQAETVSRFKRIVEARQFIMDAVEGVVVAPIFVTTIVIVMALFSVRLASAVVLLTVLYAIALMLLRPVQRRWFGEVAQDQEGVDLTLTEIVRGLGTIKASGAQQQVVGWWQEATSRHGDASHRANQWQAWSVQLGFLKDRLLSVVALAGGALEVFDGRMSIGSLVAFSLLLRLLATHADRLVPLWHRYLSISDWVKRLDEQLRDVAPDTRRQRLPTCTGHIALHRVSYRYGSGIDVLSNLNVSIAPGSIVGIVGPSGSGKSTFLKVITGLYRPRIGACQIDGHDIRLLDQADVHRAVALVEQAPILFRRSIVDNLRLGAPDAPFEDIVSAARLARAHEFIMRLPAQYETVLQEGGADLSVGQRQCLALARALAVKPRILLLDEVTSGLDFEVERTLLERLPLIAKDRTVLMISHRPECLRIAGRILAFAGGKVVEDGSATALTAKGGYVARLLGPSPKAAIHAAE